MLNRDDTDLGSVGPALVGPGQQQLFQIGKAGEGYLLDPAELGGIGGQTFDASVCGGSYGGTAYADGTIFVPCVDGLYVLDLSASSFSTAWHTSRFDAGSPVVTGRVVWTVDITNATLMGFSVTSGHKLYSFALGEVEHFTGPAADGSRIVVPADDRVVSYALG
jgi:polyvinyl alcohol dehydrogenase (cytochrome)